MRFKYTQFPVAVVALICLSTSVLHDCLAPQRVEARSRRRKAARPARINWVSSYATAQKQAKSTGRLIMVDVYTDWCGACHQLDQTTYVDPKVVALTRRFVAVKINAENGGEAFAQQYQVEGYPTILFLNSSGQIVQRVLGAYPAQQFSKILEAVSAKRSTSR